MNRYANSTHTANATAFPGLDNAFAYDSMGNRKTAGGNALALSGTVVYSGNYYTAANGSGNTGANNLNQYGSRDIPRKIDIFGWADANSTVTVNGVNATWVEDFWFNQLSYSGNNSAIYAALNVTAVLGGNTSSVTGNRFLAENPEVYSYDADGNLLTDDRWSYTWDAENRLLQMITSSAAVTAGVAKEKITFVCDCMGRKVQKKVYGWGGSDWNSTPDVNLLYLYAGWNLIAEMDATSTPVVARSYVWGVDLSGSLQGAGGVGGLLMANLSNGNTSQLTYYGYDGNGNVNALIDTTGNLVASYDYDAFGKIVQMTGDWAAFNNYKFSTKYFETNATYGGSGLGLVYYGMRFYNSDFGRWLSRDPIGEKGGENLYTYIHNDSVNRIDPLGLWEPLGAYPNDGSGSIVNGKIVGAPPPHYLNDNDGGGLGSDVGILFLADFLSGNGEDVRNYDLNSVEGRSMQASPGAQALRDEFYLGGCKGVNNFAYGTGRAFWETIVIQGDIWDTSAQVGGFAGARVENNNDGTMSFHISNSAGAHSFFYHLVPNRRDATGPFRTITQNFDWTEPIDKKKCNCVISK